MSAFEVAVADVKNLKEKPTDEELLEFYGLYRVAVGEDFSQVPEPGLFDVKKNFKYSAWKKVVDEGLTAKQAEQEYIGLVEQLKEKYGLRE